MYVSYILEKDPGMNGTVGRHPSLNFNHQNFLPAPPQYTDYSAYHHISALHGGDPNHGNLSASAWNPTYPPPREDWAPYCHGASPAPLGSAVQSPFSLNLRDGSPGIFPEPSLVHSVVTASSTEQLSPNPQGADTFQWTRKSPAPVNTAGKTRTKEKYRVVYSEHQRVELEREYNYSRYITVRRKAELAQTLSLSERQVKIWFQNRRAKERKLSKRKTQHSQMATSPELRNHDNYNNNISMATTNSSSSTGFLTDSITLSIKEEF